MGKQLVEVPVLGSLSESQQHSVEQNVDIPVHGGAHRARRDLQGSVPGQSSTAISGGPQDSSTAISGGYKVLSQDRFQQRLMEQNIMIMKVFSQDRVLQRFVEHNSRHEGFLPGQSSTARGAAVGLQGVVPEQGSTAISGGPQDFLAGQDSTVSWQGL